MWSSSCRRAIGLAALVAGAACGNQSGPSAPSWIPSRVNLLSGDRQTDTIGARLQQLVTVQVLDENGPSRGKSVTASVRPLYAGSAVTPALVGPAYQFAVSPSVSVETDNQGRAQFTVRLGDTPGGVLMDLCVAEGRLCIAAMFTVTHGKPSTVQVTPKLTWRMVGTGLDAVPWVADRAGNVISDEAQLVALTPGVGVVGRTVTGLAPGLQRFAAVDGSLADTAAVWVVPPGVLTVPKDNGIAVFNTDGSDYHLVVQGDPSMEAYWSSEGDSILYAPYYGQSGLKLASLSGWTRSATSPPLSLGQVAGAQYTRDGSWLYFAVDSAPVGSRLWRARRDGTGRELVPGLENDPARMCSLSADGNRLVFAPRDTLTIVDLRTGARRQFGHSFYLVRWSPVSEEIAFLSGGYLVVMNADGSNRRQINPPEFGFVEGLDWSPDGRWIVSRDRVGQFLLVEVATGRILPLPMTGGSPSWRPR